MATEQEKFIIFFTIWSLIVAAGVTVVKSIMTRETKVVVTRAGKR